MTTDPSKKKARSGRPSVLTMITAAAASAAAFFVITKSGIAGTLMGAAVFSAVYHGASHWLGSGVERGAAWWLGRRGVEVGGLPAHPDENSLPDVADAALLDAEASGVQVLGDEAAASVARSLEATTASRQKADVAPSSRASAVRIRRTVAAWAPLLLAVAALGASGYSVVTGQPIERVIVRERVVEKPVVEERVVVQRETVTVTVPVASTRDAAGNPGVASTATTAPTTSTTARASSTTTSTSLPGAGPGTTTTVTTVRPTPTSTSTTLTPTPPATSTPIGG